MPMNPNSSSMLDLHVAVLAFPFASHATPLFNLTRRLASFAPNVIFSFFSTSQSNAKVLSAARNGDSLPNIKAYDVSDGVPEGYVFKGVPQEDIELFMVAAPETLRKAVAEAEVDTERRVSCMMGDAFLWFVVEMAEEKGVPWVATYISEEHSLSAHVYTDLIREKIGLHEVAEQRKDEPLDFIPGMSKIRVQDLPIGIVVGNFESFFARMLHQMGRVLPRAAAVCVSSCDELDPDATSDLNSKLTKLLNVGPLNLIMPPPKSPDTYNCLSWLDKQEPHSVVYISFGSIVRPSPSEIAALAEALEESKAQFLWSLRDDLKVHLPLDFLENNKQKGIVAAWVPQTDILAHKAVAVFITHFGYNSIMESILSEVPMVGRPFLGEQKLNGRIVEAMWEIGMVVEGGLFTKDGVVRSLAKIIHHDEGKRMRLNIKNIRQLVQAAVEPKGSCNQNFRLLLNIMTNTS